MRLLYNDNYSSYNSLLLKAKRPTIEVSRLKRLVIEVFKTFKIFNSRLYAHLFQERFTLCKEKNDLVVNRVKTKTFGEKSLRTLGPKTWNSLPEDVKDLTSLPKFIEFIKTWYGSECRCNICKYAGNPYHYTWTSHTTILAIIFWHFLII